MMAMVAATPAVVPVLRSMVAAAAAVAVMVIAVALLRPSALSRLGVLTRNGIFELMAAAGTTRSVPLALDGAFPHHLDELYLKGKRLASQRVIVIEVHDAIFDLDASHLNLLTISRTKHDGLPYGHLLPVRHHAAGNLFYEVTTPFPISFGRLKPHRTALALLHLENRSIEAGDHLTRTHLELNGFATLVAVVEFRSVIKRAHVVNSHPLSDISHALPFPVRLRERADRAHAPWCIPFILRKTDV